MTLLQVKKAPPQLLKGKVEYVPFNAKRDQGPSNNNQHVWAHEFQWQVTFPKGTAKGKIAVQHVYGAMVALDGNGLPLSEATFYIIDVHPMTGDTASDTQDFAALSRIVRNWNAKFPKLKTIKFTRSADWNLYDSVNVRDHGANADRPHDSQKDLFGAVSTEVAVDGETLYKVANVIIDGKVEGRNKPVFEKVGNGKNSRFSLLWRETVKSTIVKGAVPVGRGIGDTDFKSVDAAGKKSTLLNLHRSTDRKLGEY